MSRYNGTTREVKAARQLEVSRLRVKGMSIREIQAELATAGEVNPLTDDAWSIGIIQRDCKELEKAWQAAASAEIADYKARQLAEIGEAKRVAWEMKDVNQVRQLIKLEMELLGTEAPKRQEVRATVTATNEYDGMSDDDLRRELEAVGRRYAAVGKDDTGSPEDEGLDAGADSPGESAGNIDA